MSGGATAEPGWPRCDYYVSFVPDDEPDVRRLVAELSAGGHRDFSDSRTISGDRLTPRTAAAFHEAARIYLVVSAAYLAAEQFDAVVDGVWVRHHEAGVPVAVVLCDGLDVPERLHWCETYRWTRVARPTGWVPSAPMAVALHEATEPPAPAAPPAPPVPYTAPVWSDADRTATAPVWSDADRTATAPVWSDADRTATAWAPPAAELPRSTPGTVAPEAAHLGEPPRPVAAAFEPAPNGYDADGHRAPDVAVEAATPYDTDVHRPAAMPYDTDVHRPAAMPYDTDVHRPAAMPYDTDVHRPAAMPYEVEPGAQHVAEAPQPDPGGWYAPPPVPGTDMAQVTWAADAAEVRAEPDAPYDAPSPVAPPAGYDRWDGAWSDAAVDPDPVRPAPTATGHWRQASAPLFIGAGCTLLTAVLIFPWLAWVALVLFVVAVAVLFIDPDDAPGRWLRRSVRRLASR